MKFLAFLLAITALVASNVSYGAAPVPAQSPGFERAGIVAVWEKYADRLTFGRGQTLALLDDGCKPGLPEWNAQNSDGSPKTIVIYDAVDGDDDAKHEGRGYHGSTIAGPSSLNYGGKRGTAYENQIAIVRSLECCHCNTADGAPLARALQWVIDNHAKYRITTVNLAPVDDQEHAEPVPTDIDAKLAELRKLGIWVSAPAGNHKFTRGISWPACQPNCFAIGAVTPAKDVVYLDRSSKIDLVVPAAATSSSNAIICGAVMLLREAVEKSGYDWHADGPTLPDAMLKILQQTGVAVEDPGSKQTFRRLNLLAAIDHVFANGKK